MAKRLSALSPFRELDPPLVVIAGNRALFLRWCDRQGLSPYNEDLTPLTGRKFQQRIWDAPPNAELVLADGWKTLMEEVPAIAAELVVYHPTMRGLDPLRQHMYFPLPWRFRL